MSFTRNLKFIILTPVFILLTHYLAVFPHEFAHSFMAFFLGHKSNPLDITYGGTHLSNLLLLANIDENVDYQHILSLSKGYHVALIAFAGPGLANGIMYIFSRRWINSKYAQNNVYLYYFLFWFLLMNLGNLYDYVPIRTFATHGDIGHMLQGLQISSWYIYILLGYIVFYLMWHFFYHTLPSAYAVMGLHSTLSKTCLLILSILLLLGFYGVSGFGNYGPISYFISGTSFAIMPALVFICWPSRRWVKERQIK